MAKKPEPKAPQFPADTCGACKFCQPSDDNEPLCWGQPPVQHFFDDETVFMRGIPIDATWPVCFYFKPKTQ